MVAPERKHKKETSKHNLESLAAGTQIPCCRRGKSVYPHRMIIIHTTLVTEELQRCPRLGSQVRQLPRVHTTDLLQRGNYIAPPPSLMLPPVHLFSLLLFGTYMSTPQPLSMQHQVNSHHLHDSEVVTCGNISITVCHVQLGL